MGFIFVYVPLVNKGFPFDGCKLIGKRFIISEREAKQWITANLNNKKFLKPMIDGRGLVNPLEKINWVIDFADMSIEEASEYQEPFNRVRENVKPEREIRIKKLVKTGGYLKDIDQQ
mgnify:FL=1